MRNGFDASGFQRTGHNQGVHANARHRATVDVDGVDFLRRHHFVHFLEDALERKAFRWIDLHAEGELLCLEFSPEFAFWFSLGNGSRFRHRCNRMRSSMCFCRTKRFHSFSHGANVRGRRAAAAAENAHAERGGFARKKCEVFRR